MNTTIVKTNDGSDTILNKDINECYHSKHGAIVEAKHIFSFFFPNVEPDTKGPGP